MEYETILWYSLSHDDASKVCTIPIYLVDIIMLWQCRKYKKGMRNWRTITTWNKFVTEFKQQFFFKTCKGRNASQTSSPCLQIWDPWLCKEVRVAPVEDPRYRRGGCFLGLYGWFKVVDKVRIAMIRGSRTLKSAFSGQIPREILFWRKGRLFQIQAWK